jgi:hypothetical protein
MTAIGRRVAMPVRRQCAKDEAMVDETDFERALARHTLLDAKAHALADAPDEDFNAADTARLDALVALAKVPCTQVQFIAKLVYIFRIDMQSAGALPEDGEDFAPTVLAVHAYLRQLGMISGDD